MTRRKKHTQKQAARIAHHRRALQRYYGRYGAVCLCMLAAEKIELLERTARTLKSAMRRNTPDESRTSLDPSGIDIPEPGPGGRRVAAKLWENTG
jgi:hypothetical protein